MKKGITQKDFNNFVKVLETINNSNLKVLGEMIQKQIKENKEVSE